MDERAVDGLVSIGAALFGALLLGAAAGRLSAPVDSFAPPSVAERASVIAQATPSTAMIALPKAAAPRPKSVAVAARTIHRAAALRARVVAAASNPRPTPVAVVFQRVIAAEGTREGPSGKEPVFPRTRRPAAAPVPFVDLRVASQRKPAEIAAPPGGFDLEPDIADGTAGVDPIGSDVPDPPSDPQPYVPPHHGR